MKKAVKEKQPYFIVDVALYNPTPFEKKLAAMLMTFSIIESLVAMIIAIIALLLWLKL